VSRPVGPFTAHVRYGRLLKGGRTVVTTERKTLAAAENALRVSNDRVVARWITNAQGMVHSPFAFGNAIADPMMHGVWMGDTLLRPFGTEAEARTFLLSCGDGAEYCPILWTLDAKCASGERPSRFGAAS